ncbi:unnamed protein product [Oikopleura dioica]|uniref:Uncharacterized protein n=1 Tax=Oikopleura dioica TaxID=34765 RepID=E4XEK3_OIKDI|nr:unnamed protein product [Oikopleura dioica]
MNPRPLEEAKSNAENVLRVKLGKLKKMQADLITAIDAIDATLELKAKNALTLSNIKAAEEEYMNAVTSGQFVEKIEKAVDALESLDEKEQKIEEEKSKVKTLRAKNEAMAKSLAGFDQKSEEAKLEKLRQKRNELRKKLEKTKKLRADREFEYQQRLREVDSNAGGLEKRTDDGYSSENETPSMEQ